MHHSIEREASCANSLYGSLIFLLSATNTINYWINFERGCDGDESLFVNKMSKSGMPIISDKMLYTAKTISLLASEIIDMEATLENEKNIIKKSEAIQQTFKDISSEYQKGYKFTGIDRSNAWNNLNLPDPWWVSLSKSSSLWDSFCIFFAKIPLHETKRDIGRHPYRVIFSGT